MPAGLSLKLSSLVWKYDAISGRDEVIDLAVPSEPELWKTVEEY